MPIVEYRTASSCRMYIFVFLHFFFFTSTANFLPACRSDKDYGWPRFDSLEDLRDGHPKWATYYRSVYGELPKDYPVCVYDLHYINRTKWFEAGLNGTHAVLQPSENLTDGDLYYQFSTTGSAPETADYGIYHSEWLPVPNNTWIEISHAVYPTEVHGMWVWVLPGTGLWYWTGKTIVFPTPSDMSKIHMEAIEFLSENCSIDVNFSKWPQVESDVFGLCAREKGYDSVQFSPQQGEEPIGTFTLTGLFEMVAVDVDGDKTCGVERPSDTPLRQGWMASEQCRCTNELISDSCGLMPQPPYPLNVSGEEPRLCEIRENNLHAICNPRTCGISHCHVDSL